MELINFDMFIAEQFRPEWESIAKSWDRCMADQMVKLDDDGFWPYLGYKKYVARTCDLLVLYYGSLEV